MTHFAITDISSKQYRFTERMNRAGAGWAGAESSRYRVWNQDWEARIDAEGKHHLKASDRDMKLALVLSEGKRPVIHGDRGISQKGNADGNASHYYSLTRMPTRGTLSLGGQTYAVEGESWMDHEFGTSFLEKEQTGWDWFSLQFDDGSDLMLFQLRRSDGSLDPHSSGTWIGGERKEHFPRSRRLYPEAGRDLALESERSTATLSLGSWKSQDRTCACASARRWRTRNCGLSDPRASPIGKARSRCRERARAGPCEAEGTWK